MSSSAARCLARESEMRQVVGSSDGDVRPASQSHGVLSAASNVVHLQSSHECSQPPPTQTTATATQSAATAMPSQSKVITDALTVVTERLSWATDELRRTSSIEMCCQLCMLIRSCADAMQSLQQVDYVSHSH